MKFPELVIWKMESDWIKNQRGDLEEIDLVGRSEARLRSNETIGPISRAHGPRCRLARNNAIESFSG